MRGQALVTGASGYVGGRLVEELLRRNVGVRVSGRAVDVLRGRWPDVESVAMDAMDPEAARRATTGVETAYYLIHSMAEGERGFEQRDRMAACTFAAAALRSGVRRIVYLGGLGRDGDALSAHLHSRHETGRVLAEHGPPVVELRAGMVVGSGSASFRMMLDLVRRLPAMVTPRWVETRSQPIAIDDAVAYLEAARTHDGEEHHSIIDIGGAEALSFREMLQRTASLLRRPPILILPVPVLTPRLSSLWCGLVTSVPTSIARPLIDGLSSETVVHGDDASRVFPEIHPMGFDEAVQRALAELG